jgi:S-formylglutathione hydrolase FrmB
LSAEGRLGPVVTVFPDTFTSLGGNQYINSSALGAWADWLLDEVLPRVEQRYRVRRGARHRAVFGKSSGGYGALIQGLRYGERWGAIASHSGDLGFDVLYRRDLPAALLALEPHGRDVTTFVTHLRGARKVKSHEMEALMLLAMAATYDPDPGAPYGVRLPVDSATCTLDAEAWARWLAHDPLTLIEQPDCQERLRGLRGLFVDCGTLDQYMLQYPTRSLVRRLTDLGIDHRYEEFTDDHSSIDYRMDVSLPYLYERLT